MFGKYEEIIIKIPDMACDKCAKKITNCLERMNNIHKVKVNLITKEVCISYKNNLDMKLVKEEISNLGYEVE